MKQANAYLRELYLDYVNNYLTVDLFAEHHAITNDQAQWMLDQGREMHENYVLLFGN